MEVRLQPEKEAQLVRIADERGMTREELARQIIGRFLEENDISPSADPVDHRGGLGTELSALFSKHGLDAPIPELRGFTIQNPFETSRKTAAGLRPADSRGRLSPRKPSRSRRSKRA
jgi:hypothetical protein